MSIQKTSENTWQPEPATTVERWTGQAWLGWHRIDGVWTEPADEEPVAPA